MVRVSERGNLVGERAREREESERRRRKKGEAQQGKIEVVRWEIWIRAEAGGEQWKHARALAFGLCDTCESYCRIATD